MLVVLGKSIYDMEVILLAILIILTIYLIFKINNKNKKDEIEISIVKPFRHINTVVIMTMLGDFDSYYSLVSVIMDQMRMLKDKEYNVELWVTENANFKKLPELHNVVVRKIVPSTELKVDTYNDLAVLKIVNFLALELSKYDKVVVITHDIMYIDSYINYAIAVHRISAILNNVRWLHGCHSGPSHIALNGDNDIRRHRYSLPDHKHKILTFAKCHIDGYSKMYGISRNQVVFSPSARDLRYIFNTTDRVKDFISQQQLYNYDIVQVFPACSTRLGAKGAEKVVRIFAEINKTTKCKLVFVNPNPGSDGAKNAIAGLKNIAKELGAEKAIVFASEYIDKFNAVGITSDELSSLMLYSNVFIFPTIAETGSLVAKEAALVGCLLVLNSDVPSLDEISSEHLNECIMINWGNNTSHNNDKDTAIRVASLVIDRLKNSTQNKSKRRVLKEYSIEYCGEVLNKLVVNEFNSI